MAKRQSIRRIDSEEVMGEGSYVIARSILYSEARGAKDEGDDKDIVVLNLVADSLVEWDWVDFDGNDMPLPKDGTELSQMLTIPEVQFLTQELMGSLEKQKN